MTNIRNIFKPDPDMRFKLYIENNKIKNSSEDFNLFTLPISRNFCLEIVQNGIVINLLLKNEDGKTRVAGLPIFCEEDTLIRIIDSSTYDILKEINLMKGRFIDYQDLFQPYDVIS